MDLDRGTDIDQGELTMIAMFSGAIPDQDDIILVGTGIPG